MRADAAPAAPTPAASVRRRRVAQQPPIVYPNDRATRYALDVVEGRVIAGDLVKRACQRHLDDLEHGAERGLVWDPRASEHAINFFPVLRHYKGRWGPSPTKRLGDPIVLQPWQCFIVGCAFGWKRADGLRRFRTVYIEVAAKNGKTLIAAGVGILLAFFDGEPGAEVYAAATKLAQSKIVHNDARRMVKASPALRSRIEVHAESLSIDSSASKFVPLGQDSAVGDQGINVHGAVIDELHVHTNRDLMDNIEKATAAREQPLVWKITTAGVKRESVWASVRKDAVAILQGRAVDDSQFAVIYTLDQEDDPFDETVWIKANPNLDVSIGRDFIRERAAIAARSPGALAPFLRYHMDRATQVSTAAISMDEWDQNADEPVIEKGDICYAGLDLASVQDLTALILIFKHGDLYDVLCRFWCPEVGIDTRSRVDGVPYDEWVNAGLLVATPGNVTDYKFVRSELLALAEEYQIAQIGFDPYNATQLSVDLTEDGASVIAIPQTFGHLGPAWRELEKLTLEHRLRHGGHPILRWMAGNVEVVTDPAGNQRPSKAHSSERIDGMVALDMALGRLMAAGEPVLWGAA